MSVDRIAAWTSSVVVAATVVAGLGLAGSPGEERARRLDERRIQDLKDLARRIEDLTVRERDVPASPGALVDGLRLARIPTDPVTGAAYAFERLGSTRFRLCADFAARSRDDGEGFWTHGPGRHCFTFAVTLPPESAPGPRPAP